MPATTLNADAPWDVFSSDGYFRHNYESLCDEDREILSRVGAFFASAFGDRGPVSRAIDVGSGTNLYPALLMLPWAERIQLTDFSENNVRWLCDHVKREDGGPWTWEPFWRELTALRGYDQISEPRKQLREACAGEPGIQRRSVFDLPEAGEKWQLGTMFFVAESITAEPEEFEKAVRCFVGALEPGAPFAAAFMAGSVSYKVDDIEYPSTKISTDDVTGCLEGIATGMSVELLAARPGVRKGYTGMIVATGSAAG